MTVMEPLVIDGRTWTTPLTGVALRRCGSARLTRQHYRGIYRLEGVAGREFYRTKGWLPVTGLQLHDGRRWATWMVDDPLHWLGMAEAVAALPPGRILVAGLGLGLMLHHMATQPRFTAITVVERSRDVVALVDPTLPRDPRVAVVVGDFYAVLPRFARADGILWDLAVGAAGSTFLEFRRARTECAMHAPSARLVQFGLRATPRPAALDAIGRL